MATDANAKVGGITPDKATVDFRKQLDSTETAQAFASVEENELKKYINVTYGFTLAPLTPQDLDSLQSNGTYSGPLKNIVLSSGGRQDAERVSTFYGKPEYFINNVEITSFATPTKLSGLSGNWLVNFDVIEPYSMGLFMQSLQTAALNSGLTSYVDCVWLLRVEFFGVDDRGKQVVITNRDYPIKLMQIQFSGSEGGSKYIVKALDSNLEAFNNIYGTFHGTMTISGTTVGQVFQALEKALNEDQELQEKNQNIQFGDRYRITVGSQDILNSLFVAADSQQAAPGDQAANTKNGTEGRGNQRKPGLRSFTWAKLESGRRVTEMISEIMLASEYCVNARKPDKIIPPYGYVRWYRPSAKLSFRDKKFKLDAVQNRPVYDIEYHIKPYLAHHSNFELPSEVTLGFEKNAIPSTIKKKYDYIYTGQNDDIIRWELKFDNTFYTAISSQGFQNQRGNLDPKGKTVKSEQNSGGNTPGTNTEKLIQLTPAGRLLRDSNSSYWAPMGGGTIDTPEIRVARAFEQTLLLETDMITLDLTILGDPYYLSKSGVFVDNVGPESEGSQKNNDNTMSSEDVEIRVYLRFKSPIDSPPYGQSLYQFPAAGFVDSPYSGLYRVRTVKSKFNDGVFTQELNLFRDRGQPIQGLQNTRLDPTLQVPGSLPVDSPITSSYYPPSTAQSRNVANVVVTNTAETKPANSATRPASTAESSNDPALRAAISAVGTRREAPEN